MAYPVGVVEPLRYLSASAVDECLPNVEQRLELAARALVALAHGEAEMPPKIGIHPRPGALLHAMPAWLRGPDVVGLKWVAAFPDNRRLGLPAINGLLLLNDAESGLPTWVMDAGRITAVRTAAVSGVAIRLLAPADSVHVAILGAGVQARSHLEVVAALLPQAQVAVYDRHPDRSGQLAAEANRAAGREWVKTARTAHEAANGAQIVITVATLGSSTERIGAEWLQPAALVVAVDFATYVAPELAHGARQFIVDDRAQFLAYREAGYFEGYPDPTATLGELLSILPAGGATSGAPIATAPGGPVLVTHLGVGLADVLLADVIRDRAKRSGIGLDLPR